jgi:hypothetical protein
MKMWQAAAAREREQLEEKEEEEKEKERKSRNPLQTACSYICSKGER